ncbi:type II toxin-antitoxin system Phd/YefM family antitoxin [Deinococcus sp.]|uniref:type II toxin-antitoxin system Phd/YefM family antitoxin n=1 Tax=Deinococcus sp. TaxID=47478 RepID=UPI0025D3B372|nr:type II toxin-antitoxin system Phd/YefM family antitoxin [Deinococcus sp.]
MSAKGKISASEVRAAFNDVINRVSYGHERVTITRNGKPAAVLVSVEDLELLERLEDAYWGMVASERLEESKAEGAAPRRWRDIKTERGL